MMLTVRKNTSMSRWRCDDDGCVDGEDGDTEEAEDDTTGSE